MFCVPGRRTTKDSRGIREALQHLLAVFRLCHNEREHWGRFGRAQASHWRAQLWAAMGTGQLGLLIPIMPIQFVLEIENWRYIFNCNRVLTVLVFMLFWAIFVVFSSKSLECVRRHKLNFLKFLYLGKTKAGISREFSFRAASTSVFIEVSSSNFES